MPGRWLTEKAPAPRLKTAFNIPRSTFLDLALYLSLCLSFKFSRALTDLSSILILPLEPEALPLGFALLPLI